MSFRIGQGYDIHRLVEGRPLILGGITIDYEKGLLGHSDADALLHAITDALLGAAGLGDIGRHFPDTDPAYKDADSKILLSDAVGLVVKAGWAIVNVDANCHIRLHQQALPDGAHILINDFRIGSQVQDDIYQLWLQSQRRLLPMLIHRDEAMAECLAAKQPVGEYRSDALAAEEILTLANWCLLNYSGLKTPVGSAS